MLKVIVLSRFLCKIVKYLNDGLPYKFYCFFLEISHKSTNKKNSGLKVTCFIPMF